MDTLRDKIHAALWGYTSNDEQHQDATRAIMHIIESHIEWSRPKDCRFGHVYSDCGAYEITDGGTLYYIRSELGEYTTMDDAKKAALAHKEAQV